MINIVIPLLTLSIGLIFAYIFSKHKSQKAKQTIWGLALIIIVAPFFSWLVGGLYASFGSVETTGWAEIIYPMLIFPIISLIGIGYLIKGISSKKK